MSFNSRRLLSSSVAYAAMVAVLFSVASLTCAYLIRARLGRRAGFMERTPTGWTAAGVLRW